MTRAAKGTLVQARLDAETEKALVRLRRRTGLSDSELLRRALRLLSTVAAADGDREIAGLGKFASGTPDLGSNKEHLAGFGKS